MRWQDLVFSLGSVVLGAALVPMVLSREKPPLSSSLPTSLVLAAFLPAYASFGLWMSLGAVAVSSGLWLVLAVQRVVG